METKKLDELLLFAVVRRWFMIIDMKVPIADLVAIGISLLSLLAAIYIGLFKIVLIESYIECRIM